MYPTAAEYYYDFKLLHNYRHPEGGLIPLSEIESYLNIKGITDPDIRTDFLNIINSMDLYYMEYDQKKNNDDQDSQSEG